MGIIGQEPVLSRPDRLDNTVRQIEEIRGSNCNRRSGASTPSSGTCTDGHPWLLTAKTLEKYCRPMGHVMVETRVKGTLIQRLDQAEDRLLKMEEEKRRQAANVEKKKGIEQFVKQCVMAKQSQHKRAEWKLA
ncbi:hypothetical protein V6N13_046036 [Hibiscus sabdariffa]